MAPLAELMDEHYALLDELVALADARNTGDLESAAAILRSFAGHLRIHVHKEEDGVFAALRAQDEFVDEVDALEEEHVTLDAALARLVVTSGDFPRLLGALADDLEQHIERENLGVFPVSVVTLHASGWNLVEQARSALPTFLKSGAAEAELGG